MVEGSNELFESVGGINGASVGDDGSALGHITLVFITKVVRPFKC